MPHVVTSEDHLVWPLRFVWSHHRHHHFQLLQVNCITKTINNLLLHFSVISAPHPATANTIYLLLAAQSGSTGYGVCTCLFSYRHVRSFRCLGLHFSTSSVRMRTLIAVKVMVVVDGEWDRHARLRPMNIYKLSLLTSSFISFTCSNQAHIRCLRAAK